MTRPRPALWALAGLAPILLLTLALGAQTGRLFSRDRVNTMQPAAPTPLSAPPCDRESHEKLRTATFALG